MHLAICTADPFENLGEKPFSVKNLELKENIIRSAKSDRGAICTALTSRHPYVLTVFFVTYLNIRHSVAISRHSEAVTH